MKIVRFRHGSISAWGLVDDQTRQLRHVLGGFSAWAPLIANGAGPEALPCSGQRLDLSAADLMAPIEAAARIFSNHGQIDVGAVTATTGLDIKGDAATAAAQPMDTLHPQGGERGDETVLAAALIGAPLAGRRNPLRSIFGYGLAIRSARGVANHGTKLTFAPSVISRRRFGDDSPDLNGVWSDRLGRPLDAFSGLDDLADQILRLDAKLGLKPGDVVLSPLQPLARSSPMGPRAKRSAGLGPARPGRRRGDFGVAP
jgi:hypothetical protein